MGHPRKKRKKYSTPRHPWQAERIEKEKKILETYALKNKKEIWKMQSILSKYTTQAKNLANTKTEQAKKEKEQMIGKLFKLGLVKKNANVDDVLGLNLSDIMGRRLQTLVYKRNLANTPKQARQFISHGHIFIDNKKVSVPSYMVNTDEENKIEFKEGSSLIGKFGEKEEEKVKKKVVKKVVKKEEKTKETPKKEVKKKETPKEEKKKVPKKKEDEKKV
tara:strand:+ start:217 stop:873 length:657 start_codon:yes stop_codon:yes gene_type:complete